jgi:N utilization substance protein A
VEIQVKQLVMAIRQIAEEKNLPEDVVQDVIEQAIAAAWRRDYGDREQEVTAQINLNSGDVIVTIHKEVVESVEHPEAEVTEAEAKKIDKTAKLGDTVEIIEKPTTFGRVAAQTAKQVILQKLREAEREVVLEEYSDKIGTVVNGVVNRVEARIIRVDLGRATGIMPKSEQIPGEYYSVGARIKVYLKDVERGTRGPQLILSRANEDFIKLLFANEVPEMENGAVEIKAIAREAGVRTKIAVASTVPGVDPVGTFVGGHGTRVQAVMSEIGDNEKIDIITYDEDTKAFIINALSPTEVSAVELDETVKKAIVKVAEDQLSIAIGRGGQNVRLASKLSGYEIDIASTAGEVIVAEKPEKPKTKKPKNIEDSLLAAIEETDEKSDDVGKGNSSSPSPEAADPEEDTDIPEAKETDSK